MHNTPAWHLRSGSTFVELLLLLEVSAVAALRRSSETAGAVIKPKRSAVGRRALGSPKVRLNGAYWAFGRVNVAVLSRKARCLTSLKRPLTSSCRAHLRDAHPMER